MTPSFIEPCCIEKQLPPILRQNGIVAFQTNGDITFEHIIKAISCLAGNEITIYLMANLIDVTIMRNLAWLARRGWLKTLHILTQEDQSASIYKQIHPACPDLHCYHSPRVLEDLLIIQGESGHVALQGCLLNLIRPSHRFYTAYYTPVANDLLHSLTSLALSLFRTEDTPTTQTAEGTASESTEDASEATGDTPQTEEEAAEATTQTSTATSLEAPEALDALETPTSATDQAPETSQSAQSASQTTSKSAQDTQSATENPTETSPIAQSAPQTTSKSAQDTQSATENPTETSQSAQSDPQSTSESAQGVQPTTATTKKKSAKSTQ